MDVSFNSIMAARSLEDLWLINEKIQVKPNYSFVRKIINIWDDTYDLFTGSSTRQSLADKVICVTRTKMQQDNEQVAILDNKINELGLREIFNYGTLAPVEWQNLHSSLAIQEAQSLEDLRLVGGRVKPRPTHPWIKEIICIWERIRDTFDMVPSRQLLENKVSDLLFEMKTRLEDRTNIKPTFLTAPDIEAKVPLLQRGNSNQYLIRRQLSNMRTTQGGDGLNKLVKQTELAWVRRDIKKASGSTGGTYYIRDLEGKDIAIFKVAITHCSLQARIERFIKSFLGQRSYLSNDPMAETHAEAAAKAADDFFRLNLVPQSRTIRENPHLSNGNLQCLVEGHEPERMDAWLARGAYEAQELEKFQQFAFFDYAVLGNLDRHKENWFVILDTRGGELQDINAIDNANTFPKRNHDRNSWFPAPRNQYAWAREIIANLPASEETKNWVRRSFSPESRAGLINYINHSPDCANFLDERMQMQMHRRMDVLLRLIDAPDFCPAQLLRYRYEDDVADLIGPLPNPEPPLPSLYDRIRSLFGIAVP